MRSLKENTNLIYLILYGKIGVVNQKTFLFAKLSKISKLEKTLEEVKDPHYI